MKIIELSDRIVPVDKIDFLTKSDYCKDRGYLYFKDGNNLTIHDNDFKIVREYLLSLNEEDKKPLSEVQRLFNKLDIHDQEYILNILRLFNDIPIPKKVEK